MVLIGNLRGSSVCNNDIGVLLLLGYGLKLGDPSLCLAKDGLECLYGLKDMKGLRIWRWWRVVCCGEENQPGLAAISGGTLKEEKVL